MLPNVHDVVLCESFVISGNSDSPKAHDVLGSIEQDRFSSVVHTLYLARFYPTTNPSLTEEDWVKLEIADIDVNLFKSRKKEDNCESYIRKLFGSSSCPSLQLVGRVAGLLVKVNKNRERATPSPDMQRCAKEKYKLVYQVFARAHNTQHMCPMPNWCYANAGPLKWMFPTPRSDNIEKSPILVQPVHHHGLPY